MRLLLPEFRQFLAELTEFLEKVTKDIDQTAAAEGEDARMVPVSMTVMLPTAKKSDPMFVSHRFIRFDPDATCLDQPILSPDMVDVVSADGAMRLMVMLDERLPKDLAADADAEDEPVVAVDESETAVDLPNPKRYVS